MNIHYLTTIYWRNNMPLQTVEMEEVALIQMSDESMEYNSSVEALGAGSYNSTGLIYNYC
jgi:hypothetical protein